MFYDLILFCYGLFLCSLTCKKSLDIIDGNGRPLSPNITSNINENNDNTPLKESIKYNKNKIIIIKGDIFNIQADALANAANESCLGGSGIDGEFEKRGGYPLSEARKTLPIVPGTTVRCPTGNAKITISGKGLIENEDVYLDNGLISNTKTGKKIKITKKISSLKSNFVIHAVGPKFSSSTPTTHKITLLKKAYESCLSFVSNPTYKIESIAFCLISAAIFSGSEKNKPIIIQSGLEAIKKGIEDLNIENKKIYIVGYTYQEYQHLKDAFNKIKWN